MGGQTTAVVLAFVQCLTQLAENADGVAAQTYGAARPSELSEFAVPHHQLTNATGRADGPAALPLQFNVSDDGSILVDIDGQTATISSSFTSQDDVCSFGRTPYDIQGGWSAPLAVDHTVPGRVRMHGVASSFSVDRLIVSESGRLLVNDTIRVQRKDVAGNATIVQQSHSATLGSALTYTSVDGPNDEYATECVSESVGTYGSPSVFVAARNGTGRHVGVGLLALDDVFGLHARTVNAAVNNLGSKCPLTAPSPSVSLQDMQFGLRGPTQHTAEWSIYATGSGCTTTDPYWCFANAVRKDIGVSGSLSIDGNGILNAMRWGDRLAPLGYQNAREWRQWSPEKMGMFLDTNAFDWVASDIPWNDKKNLCEPGNPHYVQGSGFVHEASSECEGYIRDLVKAVKTARPKVKVLVYFHAFLSGESNATAKYPHDQILDDQGHSVCWDSSACTQGCEELVYFYGNGTNEYSRQLDMYIDKVFELGADGIYHDESAYSVTSQHGKDFGQILYNPNQPWDGVTVATTTATSGGGSAQVMPTLSGLPSMTALVRLQHKQALYARVFERGGLVVANDPPVTRTFRRWLLAQAHLHASSGGQAGGVAVHFAETGQQVRGRVTHFFTPVMLDRCGTEGQSPDDDPKYNHTVGISAGLNIGAHLDYGTLSVMCTEPMANSTHNILQTMFPITPVNLGPGTIVGVERTITKVSGSYCWACTSKEELTAHVYDKEGFLVRIQLATAHIELELDMDAGQIAVVSHSKID